MAKPTDTGPDLAPRCPTCGKPGKASGAQQFRKVNGMRRLHAHMTDSAGHEWWDRSPAARKLGRLEDRRRRDAGIDGLDPMPAVNPDAPAVG